MILKDVSTKKLIEIISKTKDLDEAIEALKIVIKRPDAPFFELHSFSDSSASVNFIFTLLVEEAMAIGPEELASPLREFANKKDREEISISALQALSKILQIM